MDEISKLRLKINNTKKIKRNTLTLSVQEAENLLAEVESIIPKQNEEQVDDVVYIEIVGEKF